MTLVTGTVQDLGYDGMEGTLWARPARFRSDGQVVLAPERKPYKITGGVVSAELAPGPAVLELQVGSHARGTFEVVIPEAAISLADLLDTVFPWEPAQVSLFVAEREAAQQAKADAEQAATLAGTAKTGAELAAQQTGQDRTAVAADKQVVVGHVQALAAPNDAAVLGLISEGATTQTKAALDATYATKGANTFTGRQTVPSIQLTTQTDAITLRDTLGTHGRRLSIEPADPLGDRAVQMQLIPGETVSQDTTDQVIQSQILMFGRIGADYERLLIDGRGKEFRVTTSKRADGTVRPLVFQIEDNGVSLTQVASIRPGGQFRVHGVLQLGALGDASMSRIAAGVIQTPGEFRAGTSVRAASGTAQEIQFGNVGGFGTATAIFGGDSYLVRSGANYLRTMGGFRVDGELRHQGSTAGFFNAPPSAKPVGVATTASAIHAALVSLGLIGA